MSLIQPDLPFSGITTLPHRKALHAALTHQSYPAYLSPAAGQFSDAETMVAAGVSTNLIETSDVTLFSSVFGYLADPTKNLHDLGFKILDEPLAHAAGVQTTPEQCVAQILYAIKYAQIQGDSHFLRWQQKQWLNDADRLLMKYAEVAANFKKKMYGISYQIRDMVEHTTEFTTKVNGCVVYSPLWYKNGYKNMFNPHGIYEWAAPVVPELTQEKASEQFNALLSSASQVFVFTEEKVLAKLVDKGWHKVSVEKKSDSTYRYLLSNKAVNENVYKRSKIVGHPTRIHPFYQHEVITKESDVRLLLTSKQTAMYYYDAMIKNLGMPGAELFYLMVIDGKVAGVTGLHLRDWRTSRKPVFMDVFSITVPETKYKLGTLMTRLLCLQETADKVAADYIKTPSMQPRFQLFQTTFLSRSPSIMKIRGLMKLITREVMANGMHKLVYRCLLKKETTTEANWPLALV